MVFEMTHRLPCCFTWNPLLGAYDCVSPSGNTYSTTLSSCDCPAAFFGGRPCKHSCDLLSQMEQGDVTDGPEFRAFSLRWRADRARRHEEEQDLFRALFELETASGGEPCQACGAPTSERVTATIEEGVAVGEEEALEASDTSCQRCGEDAEERYPLEEDEEDQPARLLCGECERDLAPPRSAVETAEEERRKADALRFAQVFEEDEGWRR
jgi:hypothetical protein